MPAPFDPAAHSTLADLGSRLRELAGDAPYQAGRDYLKKKLVKQGTVAGTTAYASVTGSTDYRVSVAFAGELKVTCTCPAHRRSKYCKHVVAVCLALSERPGDFVPADPAPLPEKPAAGRRKTAGERPARTGKAEQRSAGLETLDRLLAELADGGVMTLGPDKAALLAGAGELVRSLKLRRLGNLVLALQRATGGGRTSQLDAADFATLVTDLYVTRQAVGAHLEGRISLDPQLAEDLLGKTWREEELQPAVGLDLLELAYTVSDDREFRIETSHLADLQTGTLYAEKQITPSRMASAPKPRHRQRLLVEQAGLYPGLPPQRIRLQRVRRLPLLATDVDRLLACIPDSVAELRRRLVRRLQMPFGPGELPVLFRPARLVAQGDLAGALDGDGRFVALDWPDCWREELPQLLPEPGSYALFGFVSSGRWGLQLRCVSVVGSELRSSGGPLFPDAILRQGVR